MLIAVGADGSALTGRGFVGESVKRTTFWGISLAVSMVRPGLRCSNGGVQGHAKGGRA